MGDLISRSALIKHLTDWRLQECPIGVCDDETETYKTICECIEAVEEQPTAYNVENVVAEIIKQFGCKDCEYTDVFPTPAVCSCECAELEVINDICEIVKRGGVDEC